jgi:plasmid stabilization system protein ParE
MSRFVLTPAAEDDIREILDYIERDNLPLSDEYVMAFVTACDSSRSAQLSATSGPTWRARPFVSGVSSRT